MRAAVITAIAVALGVPASPAPSPAPSPARTAAELTALLREFLAAAGRNDVAVFERFFADDLIYTRSAGLTVAKPDILKSVRESAAQPAKPGEPKTTYDAEDVTVRELGDAAIVNFRLVQLQDGRRAGEFRNTGTFLRRGGRWQVAGWQATRVPRPADAARQEVAAVEAALQQATLAADVTKLEAVIDEGFVWTLSAGNRVTRAELIEQLRSGKLRYANAENTDVSVSVHGETAVVRGTTRRMRSARPDGPPDTEPITATYTLTFALRGGEWKAVALHTSRR